MLPALLSRARSTSRKTVIIRMTMMLFGFVLLLAVIAQAEKAPTITSPPHDQYVVDKGVVSFICKVSGDPEPSITWTHNYGEDINAFSHQRYSVMDMLHGSVLRIEPVRLRDDGSIFFCVADNGIGDPVFCSATLVVLEHEVTGYPTITESPTLKAVEKGRSIVMMCAASGNKTPEIMWLKDFLPVNMSNPRFNLLPAGSLQIKDSQEEDEGKYECVAENQRGVAYSYGANLYVRVRRVPPHFTIPLSDIEIQRGEDESIACRAVGSPMPSVQWWLGLNDADGIPQGDSTTGESVLTLTNIRYSETYTCIAENRLGKIAQVIKVIVPAPSKPSNPPSQLTG